MVHVLCNKILHWDLHPTSKTVLLTSANIFMATLVLHGRGSIRISAWRREYFPLLGHAAKLF